MWVKRARLEEAYRREKSTSKEDWPNDQPQKIIYEHQHGPYSTTNELHDTLIYEAKKYDNGSPMISK